MAQQPHLVIQVAGGVWSVTQILPWQQLMLAEVLLPEFPQALLPLALYCSRRLFRYYTRHGIAIACHTPRITGGGAYCDGGTGVHIGLNGSNTRNQLPLV